MPGLMQRSLGGGEIARTLEARGDTTKYATGAELLDDWLIDRDATAFNRSGTRDVAAPKVADERVRYERFVFNDEQTYVLEIGEGYIRFFQRGEWLLTGPADDWSSGQTYAVGDVRVDGSASGNTGDFLYCVARHTSTSGNAPGAAGTAGYFWTSLADSGSSAILEVPTPYLWDELEELVLKQSADIVTITHRNHPPHELVRRGASFWTMLPIRFGSIQDPPGTIQVGAKTGTGSGNNLRYAVTAVRRDTFEESIAAPGAAVGIGFALGYTGEDDVSVISTGHGRATGDTIVITSITPSAGTSHENARLALEAQAFQITVVDAATFTLDGTAGLYDPPVAMSITSHPGVTIGYALAYFETDRDTPALVGGGDDIEVTWTAQASAERYYIYRSEDEGPFEFIGETTATSWTDTGKVDPSADFTLPQYRNPFRGDDRPAVSTYFQQRQLFGGTKDNPLKVWGSVTGDFRNFTTRSAIQDDDALSFTLASTEASEIVGLDVLGQLIIRTAGSIWTARGDADGSLTPTSINLERLSAEGSSRVDALLVGDSLLFPQARGEIARQLRYDLQRGGYGGYAGADIRIFASHLFAGRTIKSWAYATSPYSHVWTVFDDGSVAVLTHVEEQEVMAWTRATLGGTDAKVLWVTSVPEDGVDTPYFYVSRTVNSATTYRLERLAPRLADSPNFDITRDSEFLDAARTFDGKNAGSTTMTLTGGTTWASGEAGLTLTASADVFGVGTEAGNELLLTGADGQTVRVQVTDSTVSTVSTVTLLGIAPASLQGVATTTWTRFVDEVSGLEHLEGESVGVLADGAYTTATVSSGAIPTLSAVAAVIHVGLPHRARAESLRADIANQVDSIADRSTRSPELAAFVYRTRGMQAGQDFDNLYDMDTQGADVDSQELVDGMVRYRTAAAWRLGARVCFEQALPYPARICGFIPNFEIGGR